MTRYLCPRGESYPVRPDGGRCPTHLLLVTEIDDPALAVSALAAAARPAPPQVKEEPEEPPGGNSASPPRQQEAKRPKKTVKKAPKGR